MTQSLVAWQGGDERAFVRHAPALYAELRRLAKSRMRGQRSGHLLQTTALVHEAYLRLVAQRGVPWRDRAHFFGCVSSVMHRVLVDHARAVSAAKRGGDLVRVPLEEALNVPVHMRRIDLLDLDAALERLAAVDPLQARIVEMRFYGGMSVNEVAEVLSIAPCTVYRRWESAKAFLLLELGPGVRRDP